MTAPEAATFSVTATGDVPMTYQWLREGMNIPGATSASYTLDPTSGLDNGVTYAVVVLLRIAGTVATS